FFFTIQAPPATSTLSLHDALPIWEGSLRQTRAARCIRLLCRSGGLQGLGPRSEASHRARSLGASLLLARSPRVAFSDRPAGARSGPRSSAPDPRPQKAGAPAAG